MIVPTTFAQDEPTLIIEIYDSDNWDENAGTIFFQGRTYDILVSSENETVILDVYLSILGNIYITNVTNPFITIVTPNFNDTESFVINASKEGYLPAEVEITVMKGQLSVSVDRGTVEEKKEFQVTVKDQDNKPVADVYVTVTPESTPVITDLQGVAYVRAPDVDEVTFATIEVVKSGYFPGSTNIRIENAGGFGFDFTDSQFLKILPILLAVLVVVISIVYVLLRQKKTPSFPNVQKNQKEQPEIPPAIEQEIEKPWITDEPVIVPERRYNTTSTPTSRIEEIRLPVQAKKKETTVIPKETPLVSGSQITTKEQEEWFKGQDYMRYKLDELTGKIDQKTDGKWFEGKQDIKNKVDETIQMRYITKKVDKNDIQPQIRFVKKRVDKGGVKRIRYATKNVEKEDVK